MRKLLVLVLFLLLGFAGPPANAGIKRDEADFVKRINALRTSQGVSRLTVNANLTDKARKWAGKMAAQDRIWHSNLAGGVTANWQKLGENVGMGSSVAALNEAFVKSPRHYDNLVDPAFRFVGLGVVTVNGKSVRIRGIHATASEQTTTSASQQTTAPASNVESKVGPGDATQGRTSLRRPRFDGPTRLRCSFLTDSSCCRTGTCCWSGGPADLVGGGLRQASSGFRARAAPGFR